MIVSINTIEAAIASTDARSFWNDAHPCEDPTLASLFHNSCADLVFEGAKSFADVVLPVTVVIAAVIKARQNLTPLRDAASGEGARLDRICKAGAFTIQGQPNETWVRLKQSEARLIGSWMPSLN